MSLGARLIRTRSFLLATIIGAVGCATGDWTIPEPFVRANANVIYLMTRYQSQIETSTRKGSNIQTVTHATRYRSFDLRTCAHLEDFTFSGAARELAWDPPGDELWVTLDSEPGKARSLRGRTINLPPGFEPPPRADWFNLPPLQLARDPSSGTVRIWRVHAGSVDVLKRTPPIEAVVSLARRMVAITRSDTAGQTDLLILDDVDGDRLPTVTTQRLPVAVEVARTAHLLRHGTAIGFLTSSGLEIFDLTTAARIGIYSLPSQRTAVWSLNQPSLLSFVLLDRASGDSCTARVSTIDVDQDITRVSIFPVCPASVEWLSGSPILLGAGVSPTGIPLRWLLDLGTNWWLPISASGRHWHSLGRTILFDDGTEGKRNLMAVTPPETTVASVTGTLGDVRFVRPEPISRTTVITAAHDTVFIYREDAHRLDQCATH